MLKENYYKEPKIRLYDILACEDNYWSILVLNKLGINIYNKEYTEYEFDCIRVDIAEYFEHEINLPSSVTKNEYTKLRMLFDKIEL